MNCRLLQPVFASILVLTASASESQIRPSPSVAGKARIDVNQNINQILGGLVRDPSNSYDHQNRKLTERLVIWEDDGNDVQVMTDSEFNAYLKRKTDAIDATNKTNSEKKTIVDNYNNLVESSIPIEITEINGKFEVFSPTLDLVSGQYSEQRLESNSFDLGSDTYYSDGYGFSSDSGGQSYGELCGV